MNNLESESRINGLMIAAPNSGSGKTIVTLALLRALRDRGMDIAGAKTGPDYIDPQFHQIACGKNSLNFDPWAMEDEQILWQMKQARHSHLLVEAMMGLFDGAADGSASSADLAVLLGAKTILVVNAAKQSHSIAALVQGFRDFRDDVTVAGVILNQVGSARHEAMLRNALDGIGVQVFGAIPRSTSFVIPERHLGLVQIEEIDGFEDFIARAGLEITKHCDLDRIADEFSPLNVCISDKLEALIFEPMGANIAIARDVAFSFIYPHLVNGWREQGARISYFSPIANEGPNPQADMVYLPGGYPELHLQQLAENQRFKSEMAAARMRGALIYGECGGYMVLGSAIIDSNGKRYTMLDFLQLETSFAVRKLSLGYRQIECAGDWLGAKQWRGHEFHYSTILNEIGEPLFKAHDALGQSLGRKGLREENVMGSYMHLISPKL